MYIVSIEGILRVVSPFPPTPIQWDYDERFIRRVKLFLDSPGK